MTEVNTPDTLPWLLSPYADILDKFGDLVGETYGDLDEDGATPNAAYIVNAANNYPALIEALKDIASGRGKCGTCGTLAYAPSGGSGVTDCDCSNPFWSPIDAAEHARATLKAAGVET